MDPQGVYPSTPSSRGLRQANTPSKGFELPSIDSFKAFVKNALSSHDAVQKPTTSTHGKGIAQAHVIKKREKHTIPTHPKVGMKGKTKKPTPQPKKPVARDDAAMNQAIQDMMGLYNVFESDHVVESAMADIQHMISMYETLEKEQAMENAMADMEHLYKETGEDLLEEAMADIQYLFKEWEKEQDLDDAMEDIHRLFKEERHPSKDPVMESEKSGEGCSGDLKNSPDMCREDMPSGTVSPRMDEGEHATFIPAAPPLPTASDLQKISGHGGSKSPKGGLSSIQEATRQLRKTGGTEYQKELENITHREEEVMLTQGKARAMLEAEYQKKQLEQEEALKKQKAGEEIAEKNLTGYMEKMKTVGTHGISMLDQIRTFKKSNLNEVTPNQDKPQVLDKRDIYNKLITARRSSIVGPKKDPEDRYWD